MADVVQYRLERMVEELDDLERRGLFTRREIAEIVKQRRKFEYRLKRPSPLKQDYLAYIEYETQLDTLRRLRKRSAARGDLDKKKDKKRMKLSVSDFAGVSRIVEIYRLAVLRYKGDVDLWLRYLEFCRERSNGRMKKVLAQLIRFHPKVPGVWIYAAAWEFDHNLNVAAARALMQSGLRVCPTSEDLWVEYLRMELTYLNKLKARKVALGEGKGSLVREDKDAAEKEWRDDNKDLFLSLDEERKSGDGSNPDNHESEDKVDVFKEQGQNILQAVYSGAVEALPSSFSLRERLLEILEATDLAHSDDMRERILSDMKRDFSKDPKYWEWLARLELRNSKTDEGISDVTLEQLQKAVKVYEEALEVVPSCVLFDLYTKFLMDVVVPKDGNTQLCVCTEDWISRLLTAYEKAELVGCMSEDLACKYTSLYLQLGRFDEARKLAGELCSGDLTNSYKLWLLRVSMEIRHFTRDVLSQNKASLASIFGLVRDALTKVPLSKSEELWLVALKFFALEKDYYDKLVEMSITAVAKGGGSDCGFSLSSAVVNFILHKDGIQDARKIYERFLALPRPDLSLYRKCIELEQNLASLGDKQCLVNARKLYDSALSIYNQNSSLWRDYHSMEIKLRSETANYLLYGIWANQMAAPAVGCGQVLQDTSANVVWLVENVVWSGDKQQHSRPPPQLDI